MPPKGRIRTRAERASPAPLHERTAAEFAPGEVGSVIALPTAEVCGLDGDLRSGGGRGAGGEFGFDLVGDVVAAEAADGGGPGGGAGRVGGPDVEMGGAEEGFVGGHGTARGRRAGRTG